MEAVGLKRAGKEKGTDHSEAELVWRNRILRQKNDRGECNRFTKPRIPECSADVERASRQMEAAEDSGGSQEL
jgi:hypothetical protein